MSLTRNFARLSVLLVLSLFIASSLGAQEEPLDYDARIIEVLEGYQSLITIRLDEDVEDRPGFSWYVVGQAIEKGFLRFSVSPENNPDIISGARFSAVPGSNVTYIVFSRNLLEIWSDRPSLAYTIISGAVQDAYNFFRDPQSWGAASNDQMERLMLEMDMMKAQAELVRDRTIPSGIMNSPYENYILDSYESDNLVSAALFLQVQSLPIAEVFLQARLDFENSNNADVMRETLRDSGIALLEARNRLPHDATDEQIFPLAVAIHTWLEFSPEMISRIHNKDRQENPLDFSEVLAQESDYAKTREQLEASRIRDMLMMQHFAEATRRGFSTFE